MFRRRSRLHLQYGRTSQEEETTNKRAARYPFSACFMLVSCLVYYSILNMERSCSETSVIFSTDYTVLYARRYNSSWLPPWEPQIPHGLKLLIIYSNSYVWINEFVEQYDVSFLWVHQISFRMRIGSSFPGVKVVGTWRCGPIPPRFDGVVLK
jgi:hypothetical protein